MAVKMSWKILPILDLTVMNSGLYLSTEYTRSDMYRLDFYGIGTHQCLEVCKDSYLYLGEGQG